MADVGKIGWIDMTTENATEMSDFYATVVGFRAEDVDMGGYADYNMTMPESGEAVAGICHAKGGNAAMPAGWLIYFVVEDVEASAAACAANGGTVLVEPDGGSTCVIEDPSGAVCALYQA